MSKRPTSASRAARPIHRPAIEATALDEVRAALLAWFAGNARDLPWRRTRDPYRVLVSEVMLQQIQVSRAIPFYHAFIERFPTIRDLATAPLADAIRVWGDLGRYRRVVNLHRTARLVLDEYGGELPRDVDTLRRLPGIGPYTAGAVACFAFGQDVAFIDTNMRRVLHRLFVGVNVPKPQATDAELMRVAAVAVPTGRGWEWNQSLMDFGATLCTARRPACDRCPVQEQCRAHPAIETAVAAIGPDPASSNSAYRYEDSNRYYRGRVLARLREHSFGADAEQGIRLHDLGAQVRPRYTDGDATWLYGVVQSLAKDGLAIAEERPAYDSTGGAAPSTEVRVKLP